MDIGDYVTWPGMEEDDVDYGDTIEAGFYGRCPACDEKINPGDDIRKEHASGDWVHAGCVE